MTDTPQKTITARHAQKTASMFNLGNLVAMLPGLIVVPILWLGSPSYMAQIVMMILTIVPMLLWFGISIVVYIMARHHPNERTGHFTQQAAYRYYGVIGFIIVAGTFYGTNIQYWVITWVISALILIPWTLLDLVRIRREAWSDTTFIGGSE